MSLYHSLNHCFNQPAAFITVCNKMSHQPTYNMSLSIPLQTIYSLQVIYKITVSYVSTEVSTFQNMKICLCQVCKKQQTQFVCQIYSLEGGYVLEITLPSSTLTHLLIKTSVVGTLLPKSNRNHFQGKFISYSVIYHHGKTSGESD